MAFLFNKRAPKNERQLQTDIVTALRTFFPKQCLWLFAIDNGAFKNPIAQKNAARCGVVAGVSDLFLPYPSHGIHGLFLEIKTPTGFVRAEQKAFMAYANDCDYATAVIKSVHQAIEIVDLYLKGGHIQWKPKSRYKPTKKAKLKLNLELPSKR